MTELPPPDLMDRSGRARRLVLALIAGAAAAAITFAIADRIFQPDEVLAHSSYYTTAPASYRTVWYFTGLAGAIAFIIALKIAAWRANKQYIAQMTPNPPQARVVK